jgi:hypothetical protein
MSVNNLNLATPYLETEYELLSNTLQWAATLECSSLASLNPNVALWIISLT